MTNWSQFSEEQLQALIKSLSDDSLRTRQMMREIQEELNKQDQKKCEKFVGRYFKTNDKYFKVIGVPQFILTMTHTHYEANMLPAIIVEVDGKSFDDIYEDTIYRATIDEEYRKKNISKIFPDTAAEEITREDFEDFLNNKINVATARIASTERFAN